MIVNISSFIFFFFERESCRLMKYKLTSNFRSIDFAIVWYSMRWFRFFDKKSTWNWQNSNEQKRFSNSFSIWSSFLSVWRWSSSFENIEQKIIKQKNSKATSSTMKKFCSTISDVLLKFTRDLFSNRGEYQIKKNLTTTVIEENNRNQNDVYQSNESNDKNQWYCGFLLIKKNKLFFHLIIDSVLRDPQWHLKIMKKNFRESNQRRILILW